MGIDPADIVIPIADRCLYYPSFESFFQQSLKETVHKLGSSTQIRVRVLFLDILIDHNFMLFLWPIISRKHDFSS